MNNQSKMCLSEQHWGLARVDDAGERILSRMKKQGGSLAVGDKSEPELIYKLFSMSKGTFKKAIGGLYKQGKIVIEDNAITLVATETDSAVDSE